MTRYGIWAAFSQIHQHYERKFPKNYDMLSYHTTKRRTLTQKPAIRSIVAV